jgi:hypothetical protein
LASECLFQWKFFILKQGIVFSLAAVEGWHRLLKKMSISASVKFTDRGNYKASAFYPYP